ncbi:TPA: hypothetical protein I8Y81_002248 [Legionella pneumophila]|nr:hypothetical protein [Legionella pneumophila]HAT6956149.1 hypothetical protein [Legionella pneumophila]HBC0465073.1 hypothetical protein [Legionella pneumophila]HDP0036583.1 hypothetical protein [Legionella pneumophila]HEN4769818.1 hypothetical protein [Legionella pneumophila]
MSHAKQWSILNEQENKRRQERDRSAPFKEESDSYIEYFKEHLIEHLTKEYDPGVQNRPSDLIMKAQGGIGALSRIFDAYRFPVPNYEELNAIYQKPNGLRKHMQENLNGIIEVLLNGDRTELHPEVIKAIGQDNYTAILNKTKCNKQQIALQFLQAAITGYGQRMIDNTDDSNLKDKAYISIMPALQKLASEVTLQGLPEQSKETNPLDILKMSQDLLKLLEEANTAGITIPNHSTMREKFQTVSDLMDPNNEEYNILPKETKIYKAIENYDNAIESFITGVQETLKTKPPKPEEVHWFKRFLRFITGNEKLLQNADEKRYDHQIKVLSGINDLNEKLNSLPQEKNISSEHEHTHDHRNGNGNGNGNRMTF